VRKQGVVLEDQAQVAAEGRDFGHIPALEADLAEVGMNETRDHAQGGGLAATGGAEQGDEFAFLYLEADIVDGMSIAVDLADLVQLNSIVSHLWRLRR
jgi:hypothetical protein